MSEKNHYARLGVSPEASQDEIKQSFRRLAMKYHPDRNQNNPAAETEFKLIKEAYETLTDPKQREAYDREERQRRSRAGVSPSFEDIFGDFFTQTGNGKAYRAAERGADFRYKVEISLEQAASGTETTLKVSQGKTCPDCKGSPPQHSGLERECGLCRGSGKVKLKSGFFPVDQNCPLCEGSGRYRSRSDETCRTCRGSGKVPHSRSVVVTIPPGVEDGAWIHLAGEGEPGFYGGPPGDLSVLIKIKPHPLFTRQGSDLHCEVAVDFPTACLGGKIEVPTLAGKVMMSIPPETQTGRLLRMKGLGLPQEPQGTSGDLYCRISIKVPTGLNRNQRALIQALAESLAMK